MFIFFKDTGTKIPNKPATIMFKIIDTPINKDKLINEYGPNKNIKFDDSQDRPFAVLGQLRRKM